MALGTDHLAALIPSDFTLGVATAAFQIEGAVAEDGRGPSGWDASPTKPGRIAGGPRRIPPATTTTGCRRTWRCWPSWAWTRTGFRCPGRASSPAAGARSTSGASTSTTGCWMSCWHGDFPDVTLYHWDTPLPLEHAGGWLNRDTAYRLADFAAIAAERFGDRVDRWVTINEPTTVTLNGYGLGVHAPGQAGLFDALPAAHHLILAHGLSLSALRAGGIAGEAGITNVYSPWSQRRTGWRTMCWWSCSMCCTTGCSPTRCCWAATPTSTPCSNPSCNTCGKSRTKTWR